MPECKSKRSGIIATNVKKQNKTKKQEIQL